MQFTPAEIQQVCQLVNQLTGIQWDTEKTYLIESRFGKLMHEHRIESLTDLVHNVKSKSSVRTDFIDSVTTRETLFFRDDGPFNALQHKALPEIIDARSILSHPQRLRIWSAACSSGQEPYSIGIILHELIEDIDDWDIKILATDLAPAALNAASLGVYSDFEMSRGVPEMIRNKYFTQVPNGWKICDHVRSLVSFEPRNLLEPFNNLGPFDVIFCRNVAIYFDESVKRDLFDRLAGVLSPHGAIFIGSSETLNSLGPRWKPQFHCRGTFYQPNLSTTKTDRSPGLLRAAAKVSDSHNRDLIGQSITNPPQRVLGARSASVPVQNNKPSVPSLTTGTPNRTGSLSGTPLKTSRAPSSLGVSPQKVTDRTKATELLAAARASDCRTLTGASKAGGARANTTLNGRTTSIKTESAASRVIFSVPSPTARKMSVDISCNENSSIVNTSSEASSSRPNVVQAKNIQLSSDRTPPRATSLQKTIAMRLILGKPAATNIRGTTTIRPTTAAARHPRNPIPTVNVGQLTSGSTPSINTTRTATMLRTHLLQSQNVSACTTNMKSFASVGKPKFGIQSVSCPRHTLKEHALPSKLTPPILSAKIEKGQK